MVNLTVEESYLINVRLDQIQKYLDKKIRGGSNFNIKRFSFEENHTEISSEFDI